MISFRNIFSVMMILVILSMGLPIYQPGDANRDERVDLADAILGVRGVEQSADKPSEFENNVENALISIAMAAGFKKVLKADRNDAGANIYSQDSPCLISAYVFTAPDTAAPVIEIDSIAYRSVTISPDPYPPRFL